MVVIKAIEADDLHSFLDFFDSRAFASDPDWHGCYCQGFIGDVQVSAGQDEAAVMRSAACDRNSAGKMQGYLAYQGEQVVGWCAAGESKLFAEIPDADERLARIVCFVIQEDYRGQGIATKLLDFAVGDLRVKGFAELEGRAARPEDTSKMNFTGPYAMYLKAGFEEFKDLGEHGILMRLALA